MAANVFENVQVKTPPHSTFNLSHDWKGSLKMGTLVPVYCQEALPSDRFTISADAMFRLMPLVAPLMHKVDIFFHAFFVPNRLLWSNWNKFIWGGNYSDTAPVLPTVSMGYPGSGVVEPSSLANYLGCPVTETGTVGNYVNALPFAAYQRIWYDWYRDQNFQEVSNEFPWMLQDSSQTTPVSTQLHTLRRRAWEHDYFTSALPFVQKGPDVGIPIDFTGAEIIALKPADTASGFNPVWRESSTGSPLPGNASGAAPALYQTNNTVGSTVGINPSGNVHTADYYDPLGTLVVNGIVSSTVNDLRSAMALQRWLEKNARGGSRDKEGLLIHFGVRTSDARLDRAEYLGGSKSTMAISEVLQTSSSDATSPQANMAGHGISVSGGSFANYQCEEHGYFMCIMSVRPKTAYYQGIPRHFLKRDRLDYYFAEFAHLGEQEVFSGELVATGNPVTDMDTWGYLPRFSEYRFNPSRVVGQLATSLDFWQYGRKFTPAVVPPLNDEFIECAPDKRIFAVTDPNEDEIVGHIIFKIFARRPLPMYGTPI